MDRLEYAKQSKSVWIGNEIGDNCSFHPTAIIGNDGFGFARDTDGSLIKVNHASNVIIGNNVEIRAYVTIDRGVINPTIIGEGNKFDYKVHVAHNVKIGKNNTLAAHTIIEGSCVVGDNNTFGAGVIVQRKVIIGSNNIFGSGCVVTKDVGDNCVMVGNPARKLRDV